MACGVLSVKQLQILEYIKSEILAKGYPPTVREICNHVHLSSTSSVHSHLETLERNGYIRRDPSKPRALELIDDTFNFGKKDTMYVPILNSITSAKSLYDERNIREYMPVPIEFACCNNYTFLIQSPDESMVNIGVLRGDLVFAEETNEVQNGDHVIALVDGLMTIKTLFIEDDEKCMLKPENDFMEPMFFDNIEIIGKMIGNFRIIK